MATTDQGAAMAPEAVNEVVSTERNSVVVEPVKPIQESKPEAEANPQQATIDKMGNELGQLRKELREANQRLADMQGVQTVTDEPVSFSDDPEAFIKQTIKSTLDESLAPQLQVLNSDLLMRKGEQFDRAVSETYPDWKETAQSQDFADWVQASQARMQMYQIADQQFDVASGVELLKRFKQDQAEAASKEKGAIGAAALVQGGGDSGGARVYAASEIANMIQNDPEGYRRFMSGDGMAAYQEGRVDQSR